MQGGRPRPISHATTELSRTAPKARAPEAPLPSEALPERPTDSISRENVDNSKIIAWLCCDPLPPLPLGPKAMIDIGRTNASDLVLPHKEVSRKHALIKIRGKSIVLEDEGSSNGVLVNEQRVSSAMLKPGDKLQIGPYELEVRSNEQMAEASSPEDGATPTNLALTSLARMKPGAAMTGRLDEVPVTELLQQLEFNKKTGTLTIHVKSGEGELVVADGRPMFARFGPHRDDEATVRMALLTQGRFTFSARVEPGDRRMQGTITGILLEASRRVDEAGLPAPPAEPPPEEEPTINFRPSEEGAALALEDPETDPSGRVRRSEEETDEGEVEEPSAEEEPASEEELSVEEPVLEAEELASEEQAPAGEEPPRDAKMDTRDWQRFWKE